MTDPLQLEFSTDELFTEVDYDRPLIAGGVRCHGGYVDDQYVSPRSRTRGIAVNNWRARLGADRQPLIHVPGNYVPPNYPNYEQAKYLLQERIVDPVSRALTLIAIVEGFGARIRELHVPEFSREIVEDIGGTALAHLDQGLFEAHARDEAGHRHQGGHKQMWEAARDIGLDKPHIPGDVLMSLMMGGGSGGARQRAFPGLTARMEALITMMASVLVIETFAEDTFNWARKLLGDPEVSADPAAAEHLVACIASDEVVHVQYLETALSEIRARTLVSEDGKQRFQGSDVVDTIFSRQLRGMATNRPRESRERTHKFISEVLKDEQRASEVTRKFNSLDSGWTFPHQDDEALEILLQPAA